MGTFIIKKLFVGRLDKALEIKQRMDNGESNEEALSNMGMLRNDDLEPLLYAEDESGNILFENVAQYNEQQQSFNN